MGCQNIRIFQQCFPLFGLSRFIRHSSRRATNSHCLSTTPPRRFCMGRDLATSDLSSIVGNYKVRGSPDSMVAAE